MTEVYAKRELLELAKREDLGNKRQSSSDAATIEPSSDHFHRVLRLRGA